jgi:uncharacterized protein YcsI (UPF0317 family)
MSSAESRVLNAQSSPADVRAACRTGRLTGQTSGLAAGFVQTNLVIVPVEHAADFRLFCQRNPKPCPLLEVTSPGDPTPRRMALAADLRTDLPLYRTWQHGELVDEPPDIRDLWRDDLVAFLIGCSFTFEAAMQRAGLPVRHIEEGRNVPMFRTNVACEPAGPFQGPLVVSMRPMTPDQAAEAARVTGRFPCVHGAPVQIGEPERLGIHDLSCPDFGDTVTVRLGEVPVFWACGVTPQCALMQARLPLAITHVPGCMFVTDLQDAELEERSST